MGRLRGMALGSLGAAIFVPHLVGLGYHPFSFEVLFWLFGAGGAFFLLGWLSPWFVFVFLGFMATFWLVDSYFVESGDTPQGIIVALFLGFIALFGGLAFAQRTILPLACIAFSLVFIFPSFFSFPPPVLVKTETEWQAPAISGEPDVAFIYLILDEQMSLEALPETLGETGLADQLYSGYLKSGFQIQSLAMANSTNTFRSVGAIFGLTEDTENFQKRQGEKYSYVVNENTLVPGLQEAGFTVSIIESNFLELCDPIAAMSCETYTRGSNMGVMASLGWDLAKRIRISGIALHQDYFFYDHRVNMYRQAVKYFAERSGKAKPRSFGFFSRPLVNVEIFEDIAERAALLERGDALIVHLMLPHFPYVLDENCDLKDVADWEYPIRHDEGAELTEVYEGFWEQTHCTHKLVEPILDAVKDRDDIVAVVHGDHGSRISKGTEQENELDLLSTFLAIKSPLREAEKLDGSVSLQAEIIDFFYEDLKLSSAAKN